MKMVLKKYRYIFVVYFILVSAFVPAQTAHRIEKLLEKETLNYQEAAWIILEASGKFSFVNTDVVSSSEKAYQYAAENGWLPRNIASDTAATLEGVSFLIMHSFGIKGGILYAIFKSPHYAYRELVTRGIIQGRVSPKTAVSGDMLIFSTNQTIIRQEEDNFDLVIKINSMLKAQNVLNANAILTSEGVTIIFSTSQFQPNTAELFSAEMDDLRKIAGILKSIAARKLIVSGHSALFGTPGAQMGTSIERAQAVKEFFILQGLTADDDIYIRGFGAQRPVADNNTVEGMAKNRRVEITILE
ncbi:MAG: OmpA family protein [Treponema sp.]|jgi:outer membrane protein OmpA-like peptidoglycan-associated protein|nr:OmpA family protein [Treponema sp.]